MMKFVGPLAIACVLALSACGSKTTHATCTDNYKTSDYMKKFHDDLVAAVKAGKITQAASDQSEMDLMRFKGDPDDVGAMCVWADDQRKKLGI